MKISEKQSRAQKRIRQIKEQIRSMDALCSGSLIKRTKVCGKANCRCATDPKARHGPYFEWSRMEGGRLLHTILSADEAKQVARAIKNYRKVLALLRRWERETIQCIRNKK